MVEEAPARRVADAHLARGPARHPEHGGERLRGRLAHELDLLDEVAQELAERGLRVDVRRRAQRLVGAHHHVLAPHAVRRVAPQQPLALLGGERAVELDRVLAADLLDVRDPAHGRQDPQPLVEAVEEVERRHHQSHLSTHSTVCAEHPEKARV